MKIKNLLLLSVLLFTIMLQAQDKKDKHEQIKALKVSFFTTALDLTPDEAAKFWPIYNAYDEKQFKIRHEKMRPILKQMKDDGLDKMSAKEAEANLAKLEAADKELYNLKAKLIDDLKPVIGPIKILKLKKAEEDFKQKLLEQFKKKE
ncbi:sensor of ECF-type sigma factor [Flavobacterium sp. RHBU_3]|uniref:sensor of ECF-type sigma factor n=1 Tax=Flavobacterium sp. RHBU_3 TaxID=3391184 RepID=UPI003984D98C